MACYQRLLGADKDKIAIAKYKPLSRAYLSLDLSKNLTTTQEEQQNHQAYQTDKATMAPSKGQFLHKQIRDAIVDSSIFGKNATDELMKFIDAESDISTPLKDAFYGMLT